MECYGNAGAAGTPVQLEDQNRPVSDRADHLPVWLLPSAVRHRLVYHPDHPIGDHDDDLHPMRFSAAGTDFLVRRGVGGSLSSQAADHLRRHPDRGFYADPGHPVPGGTGQPVADIPGVGHPLHRAGNPDAGGSGGYSAAGATGQTDEGQRHQWQRHVHDDPAVPRGQRLADGGGPSRIHLSNRRNHGRHRHQHPLRAANPAAPKGAGKTEGRLPGRPEGPGCGM